MAPPPIQSGPCSSNPQLLQQFLSSVLSQRGPSALPYSEDTKWMIRQQLLSLAAAYPSLEPKTVAFIYNDGRSFNLIQASGTVPMSYQGVTYNIPVLIWLLEAYPRHPPTVYVNPTADMIIKSPHPYVNPSGLISVSYLQNWIYPSSNLVDLVRNLSSMFGRDPPLYSQRRPNPTPSISSYSSLGNFSSGNPLVSSNLDPNSYPRPVIPPKAFPPSPYDSRQWHEEDPNEVYKRNVIPKLVEMVHSDVLGLKKTREVEMEGLFITQGVLRQREEQIDMGLKEMQDEKESLEQQLQMVLMNLDILEGWLGETEGKLSDDLRNVDVINAFDCVDLLSKQMLDCMANDMAIEDNIYSLDKAVQEGTIPFDLYMRNVRLLSRQQYFHRATATKVRTAKISSYYASG